MPARSEGELRTHPSEFTVRATGADQLFQWLNVHNNAPDTDVVMGLGQPERLDDGLTLATMEDAEPFRGIVWGIVVDREDGSYELVEKIVPRSPIPKSMMGHVLSRTMASREPLEVVESPVLRILLRSLSAR